MIIEANRVVIDVFSPVLMRGLRQTALLYNDSLALYCLSKILLDGDTKLPIYREGLVTQATRQNLIDGLRARPMSPAAVQAVFEQAADFVEEIAALYETEIATGEVGQNGSGVASTSEINATRPPNALLYGRVQSGKTAAMVLSSAIAFDNHFKIIVVLTADNLELVRQTANRFRDLEGPRVISTLREDDTADWRAPDLDVNDDEFMQEIRDDGLVFVCAKNAFHLPQVLQFFQRIDAAGNPCLIFDDEADAATPDTTLQARSLDRPNAPAYASTINRRVIENTRPGEEGESTREMLPHSVYVQVTASPFVLLLQRASSYVRPTASVLLEPGTGYCGGERFFGDYDPDSDEDPDPPIVFVPPGESQSIGRRRIPDGLAASIDFALVAAATCARHQNAWPDSGFKHLSHTSPSVTQHSLVASHIDRYLRQLRRELRSVSPEASALTRLEAARSELQRSVESVPTVETLLPQITSSVNHAQVIIVNASSDRAPYGPRINFLVGGNILGRGLTIDDLLVTYYLRQARTSQMDTVLQHARMYGYREAIFPFTRLFLTHHLATLFKEIHESEQALREYLSDSGAGTDVPIKIARGSRATRPSAIETGEIRLYSGRKAQIAPSYAIEDPEIVETVNDLVFGLEIAIDEQDRNNRAKPIPLADAIEIVQALPPRLDDVGSWHSEAVVALMNSYQEAYNGNCIVYVRSFDERPSEDRTRARLSGPEIGIIRSSSRNAPALALLHWSSSETPELWYPTLVTHPNMPKFVFAPA